MLSAEGEPFLGLDGAPPERTIYLSLFQDSGLHRQGADGGAFAFSEPSKDDPRGWRPTWDAITLILGAGRPVSFQELMTELAKPPIGLRQGPALLVIAAFMLAARDRVALIDPKSDAEGKSVYVMGNLGGRRILKKTKQHTKLHN